MAIECYWRSFRGLVGGCVVVLRGSRCLLIVFVVAFVRSLITSDA